MKFTGERLVPGMLPQRLKNMVTEELARLNFAKPHFLDKVVLDLGCGVGYGTHFLAENGAQWVLGVDISQEASHYAAQHYAHDHTTYTVMNGTTLGLADECFDMVSSLEVIEHLTEPDQARYLAEICRVLKPDGKYLMSTPNRKISSTPAGEATWAFHKRELSLRELRELLEIYFAQVEIWGAFVPAYEHHPIRTVTNSPLSRIKHFLPSGLRLWFASSIRFFIKPKLGLEDVIFSKENIDNVPTFVALCANKRGSN